MTRMLIYITIFIFILLLVGGCSFYATQERLIFYPEPIAKDYTFSFNAPFEEVYIKTDSGEINALHFKTANSRGVIFYFHGNAGSLNSWGTLGEEFIKTGYDFFIFDYRGYGKSTGLRREEIFHHDHQMLYDYLKKSYREEQIILYGRSLGSGFATKMASVNHPKALILETPYYSFKSVAKYHFPYLPVAWILRWQIPTNEWIGKVSCPILIFHGTEDEVIPYEQAIRLKELIKKTDDFVTLQDGTHSNVAAYPEYAVYLKKYLE